MGKIDGCPITFVKQEIYSQQDWIADKPVVATIAKQKICLRHDWTASRVSKPIIITLSDERLKNAKYVGVARHNRAIREGKKDAHGFKGDNGQIHIVGAQGEQAACDVLHVLWSQSVSTYRKEPDIGKRTQVRTGTEDGYRLIIDTSKDKHKDIFIFVIALPPVFKVMGWVYGCEMRNRFWLERYDNGMDKAYFIPQDFLRDIRSLRNIEL